MYQLGMFDQGVEVGTQEESRASRAQQGFMFADQLESTVAHFAATGQISAQHAAILATSGLDKNQQYLALERLSARSMSPATFSKLCQDILARGNAPLEPLIAGQESLF